MPMPPTGRLHRTKPFRVPGIADPRPVTLYLPPGYEAGLRKRWPVAYLFDGQNLFGDAGTFAGGWHLHRALDARARAGLAVPVVVGIHHGAERARELSPWPVALDDEGTETAEPLGDFLLDWVVETLMPMIEDEVRVSRDPIDTILGGSSLGGMLALYGFFKHYRRFWRCLAMSPSLWVDEGNMFMYVAKAFCAGDPRLYLDCGAKEAEGIVIEHAQWMADLLERKGFEPERNFRWVPDPEGEHDEKAWRRRAPAAFAYLLDDPA